MTRAGMPPEEDTYGFEIKWDIAAVPGGLAADPAAGLTESRAGQMLVAFDDSRPTPPPRMHVRAGRSAADNARSPSPLVTRVVSPSRRRQDGDRRFWSPHEPGRLVSSVGMMLAAHESARQLIGRWWRMG